MRGLSDRQRRAMYAKAGTRGLAPTPRKRAPFARGIANRDVLLSKHEGLVKRVARQFSRRFPGAHVDDLLQEGRMGLLRAGELYRKKPGATFATYAHHHIAKRVREAARASHGIHVPDRKLRKGIVAPVDGGLEGFKKLAALGNDGGIARAHAAASVKRLLAKLPETEARVLHARYLNGQLTHREAAKKFKKSVSTIHTLERQAFTRLRRASLKRKGSRA